MRRPIPRQVHVKIVKFAALAMLAFPPPSAARTSAQVEMECPYDGTKFTAILQGSGTAFDTRLDFMPVGPIVSPWPLAICPTNGFVFFKDKFSDDELETLRPLILSARFQALKDETPYYRAAWLLDQSGAPSVDVIWKLLQATWESGESPERYARYTRELIARLPNAIGNAAGKTRTTLQIMLGELLRRLGQFDEAKEHFSQLLNEVDPLSNEWLIARYEIVLADKRDGDPHLTSAAIKHQEADPDVWLARHTPVLGSSPILKQPRLFRFGYGRRLIWSADSNKVITNDGTHLVVFDVAEGRQPIRSAAVLSATPYVVTSDGKMVVNGMDDRTRTWKFGLVDTRTFDLVSVVSVPSGTGHMALAFDGKSALASLATMRRDGFESNLVAYDLEPNELRPLPFPTFPRGSRAFWLIAADPTGPRVVFLHEDSIVVWDYERGESVLTLKPEGWTKSMTSVGAAFSSDGSRLFVVADKFKTQECELTAWDVGKGAWLATQRAPGLSSRLSVGSDGRYVGFSCKQSLTIWDHALEQRLETMTLPENAEFDSLAFSPDARTLAVHVADRNFHVDGALFVYAVAP